MGRRLVGWQAALLNHRGRLVFISSALDGLVNYIMQAVPLPPGVIAAIDGRRRAFLWSGTDKNSGAKCLVNWELAQKPKKEGRLGVRDLATQNACLLLKLLHRLHHPADSAWAAWARQHTNLVTMDGNGYGNHWEGLKALLPAYRCITKVQIGDGATTAFWWDSWLGEASLATRFPCFLSHCSQPDASVLDVICRGISDILVSRLSHKAACELNEVQTLIADVSPHYSKFVGPLNKLDTGSMYRASTHSGDSSKIYSFVWASPHPPHPHRYASLAGCYCRNASNVG